MTIHVVGAAKIKQTARAVVQQVSEESRNA